MPIRRRLWLFRLVAAVGLPLIIVLLFEGTLRVTGYGNSTRFLIPDTKPGWYRTNPDFLKLFLADSFDLQPLNFRIQAHKAPNTVRIMVLGESAAQGIPAPAFGFASQLRSQLRSCYPGKNIEVINAGIAAINSHIVLQIARDLADFEPDLFVVYMGNNEVVGPYGPGCTYLPAMPPRWMIRLSVFVHSTRTGQLLQNLLRAISSHGGKYKASSVRMETFVEQATPADDPGLAAVCRNFEANLTDILRITRRTGAKTIVCTLASNLNDCAPLLSRHQIGMSDSEIKTWQQIFNRSVVAWRIGDIPTARNLLEAARQADPCYADTHFLLGKLAMQTGDSQSARQAFIEAIRLDALGFRPGPMLNGIIRDIARRETGVELVDAALLLGSDPASTITPPGAELFLDHVHLSWAGNYQLSRALSERTAKLLFGQGAVSKDWLDSNACATTVGYTQTAEASILSLAKIILQSPPFNNQLTHCEDLARLERNLNAARACAADPQVLTSSLNTVQAAEMRDPGNSYLLEIEESLAASLDQPAVALAAAASRRRVQPDTPALATNEAIRRLQAGKTTEALALLEKTAAQCPKVDLPKMGPAFAEYYIQMKETSDGLARLDKLWAHAPAQDFHLYRASVLKSAGDLPSAEKEFRAALADYSTNQGALEGLVALLMESGRAAEADEASLAAVDSQPGNHRNNLRAALIQKKQGKDDEVIRLLLIAEKSGTVNSKMEMELAMKLASKRRLDEALAHLGVARQLAMIEENRSIVSTIDEILHQLGK